MASFKFPLGSNVEIIGTNQSGTVIAQAAYLESPIPMYEVRGLDAHGNLVQRWQSETVLSTAAA